MPEQSLRIESTSGAHDGECIVRLTGQLTPTNLFQFQAMIRAEKASVIIVDMTGVPRDAAGSISTATSDEASLPLLTSATTATGPTPL